MIRNLWGVQEVSAYLGVPVGTLYQWRSSGFGPPGRRVGKYVRYKPDEVEAWFESQEVGV
ncbi:transcriptional regulator, AlpA family [Saccharopolyspora kobensis]|uniref:DNA binding domain-containing protein, excisionase family n=1 Tax=Saccharopolyspora kobensis TaxID=146035 RepID=A0A1H6DZQ7_9PSEU|nr:helix-turn-helix domain-containing protein [Saccharopolyspora kobensis]SEG90609.1 transcriptional regulator, AlpA family [Saccharopolyspora kobensis]SFD92534.1 DNA binding domain-containing protein, excisionase family [Saccharopolyspora kobensis]